DEVFQLIFGEDGTAVDVERERAEPEGGPVRDVGGGHSAAIGDHLPQRLNTVEDTLGGLRGDQDAGGIDTEHVALGTGEGGAVELAPDDFGVDGRGSGAADADDSGGGCPDD